MTVKEPLMAVENILGDDIGYVELLDKMGDDLFPTQVARTSYLGESKGEEKDKKLLKYLIEHHHDGPFEFTQLVFRINAPIFVTRQIMRHRTFSFNEASRRYTDLNFEFYFPKEWRIQDSKNKQASVASEKDMNYYTRKLNAIVESSMNLYEDMTIVDAVGREQARMVLPQNMYCLFMMRADLRNLLHFVNLRMDKAAQYETQLYALAVLSILEEFYPETIKIYKELVWQQK